jgi:hypothetical protein
VQQAALIRVERPRIPEPASQGQAPSSRVFAQPELRPANLLLPIAESQRVELALRALAIGAALLLFVNLVIFAMAPKRTPAVHYTDVSLAQEDR